MKILLLLFCLFVNQLTTLYCYPDTKIVGGDKVDISEIPFMLSLCRQTKWHICGATLIKSNIALTAAHCVDKFSSKELFLNVGVSQISEIGTLINVTSVKIHPNYNNNTLDNDAALIYLESNVLEVPGTMLAKLSTKGVKNFERITAYGYGTIYQGGPISIDLLKINVPVLPWKICEWIYKNRSVLTKNMFCTYRFKKDMCHGDSGGPLLNKDGQQVGIISKGHGCATYPGIQANIAKFYDWIESNI